MSNFSRGGIGINVTRNNTNNGNHLDVPLTKGGLYSMRLVDLPLVLHVDGDGATALLICILHY